MTVSWDRKTDGSITLHIDGDLQFDSRDERVYHECLALPVLAVAKQRTSSALRVMIAGGADGLSARELLKDSRIESIDLVDLDPDVVSLGKTCFAELNNGSLNDSRVTIHIRNAWEFALEALEQNRAYDLIISDLTVPADQRGARMHSIEWYKLLSKLLTEQGTLAANAVSPSATPRAYWSVVNSMRSSGLNALPYRVFIPSFKALGYGDDWGFVMASKKQISPAELLNKEFYPPLREALADVQTLETLCQFPEELLYYNWQGTPAHDTSDILIHFLINDASLATAGAYWNSLNANWNQLVVPAAQRELCILPPEIRQALAQSEDSLENEQTLFDRVIALVPALRRFQTRKMIADFLKSPHMFLDAIDLSGLVQRLLRRAAELPGKLVHELKMLRDRLRDWSGDYGALLSCGSRVLTVVAAVVIIGNLMYPDSAYAKGGDHGGGGGHGDHGGGGEHGGGGRGGEGRGGEGRGGEGRGADGRGDRGFGGRGDRGFGDRGFGHRGFGDHYDHNGHWGHFSHWNSFHSWDHHYGWGGWGRPWGGWYGGGWGWGNWGVPALSTGLNFNINENNGQSVDEEGNNYPARRYRSSNVVNNYYNNDGSDAGSNQPQIQTQVATNNAGSPGGDTTTDEGDFRLGPDTDVIKGGKIAVHLTDNSYMVVNPDKTTVFDQDSGNPIMSLATDPVLLWHVASELKRQSLAMQTALQHQQNSGNWANAAQGGGKNDADGDGQDDGQQAQNESQNLQAAIDLLNQASSQIGQVPQRPQGPTPPPIDGAIEVFASTWVTPDGNYILVRRPNGTLDYIGAKQWYADAGKTPITQHYPDKFRQAVVGYLGNMVKQSDSAAADMNREQQEASQRLDALRQQLQQVQGQQPGAQDNGADDEDGQQAEPNERLRRLRQAIRRTNMRLQMLQKQASQMPQEIAAAKQALSTFQ
jgi:spermidine synthase